MTRSEALRQLDNRTRNKVRDILSKGGENAISQLTKIRRQLGKNQAEALDAVLSSTVHIKGSEPQALFPRTPPFYDRLQNFKKKTLEELITDIEEETKKNPSRIKRLATSFNAIDKYIADNDIDNATNEIAQSIEHDGWSHAILRKIVLIREAEKHPIKKIEDLLTRAGLAGDSVIVPSLIHTFSPEQNYLTIKRSISNIIDKGNLNRYTRTISRIPTQPFAKNEGDLEDLLSEAGKCSLLDSLIIAKFNRHYFRIEHYKNLQAAFSMFGNEKTLNEILTKYLQRDPDAEYLFNKQSSAWLEYEPVRAYRALVDTYYDVQEAPSKEHFQYIEETLSNWLCFDSISDLASKNRFTKHPYDGIAALETTGTVSRSAAFNRWLSTTEGQICITSADLLQLMGLTRDLARTVPIIPVRTISKLTLESDVRLILLLLLAKRSKNEHDGFKLRKLLEDITIERHKGSLVALLEAHRSDHPYVSEYIYEIATEDFLAKLNRLAPHLSDIPEIRASLHEWMAKKTGEEHYWERARAVRIDHQLNRIRNEIDDHRIYVDPSKFSSWIQDEMMIDINNALASSGGGKKTTSISADEALLSLVIRQCYAAFCGNTIFGIASYIGRRIRHGTFHGHLFSSVINQIEKTPTFEHLADEPNFLLKWGQWKDHYDKLISEIVKEKLHVSSRSKPSGLIQPDQYNAYKQEILEAAIKSMINYFSESKTTEDIDQIITDYCWRLAENDLLAVTRHLNQQRLSIRKMSFLMELTDSVSPPSRRAAVEFRNELIRLIDKKFSTIGNWFKRPSNVAPKASLSLLYDAVIQEVRDTIPSFNPCIQTNECEDIELIGGAYLVMYDSLFVAVSNAAKHGDPAQPIKRAFFIETPATTKFARKTKALIVEISSSIKPSEDISLVEKRIEERKRADFADATTYQGKSGIPKLMQIANMRSDFEVEFLGVKSTNVVVRLAYALEH